MEEKEFQLIKKCSFAANTAIMICVIGLMVIFGYFHVDYMFYHSIPTLAFYIFFYFLIARNHLVSFCWMVYTLITIYMGAATVCLGIDFGFNLYCISMIPVVFYVSYMANKIHLIKPKSILICCAILTVFLASTGISIVNGPLYEVPKLAATIFYITNSLIVFCFLMVYTGFLVKLVINSEEKLTFMAHYDNLTGLLNRHYMMEKLRSLRVTDSIGWIAMLDIDKFKSVNDTYGHNAGDYVLKMLSKVLSETCSDCIVARWGGEEFLLIPKESSLSLDILETLRKNVEATGMNCNDKIFSITISIGATEYNSNLPLEKNIQFADKCLYESKNTGRNKVTINC